MTNEIVTAVTNIVGQLGGDATTVGAIWIQYATIIGSIIGSITVIAALDPTNKIANILTKIITVFNKLDPKKSQKK